ncbi:S-adenosyl-L-methionine-dependent methyltransferase [Mycena epipterygia]|nr:S-adenosyl-L-methionine-dependent methyltransferase [Mycena epipterygia]
MNEQHGDADHDHHLKESHSRGMNILYEHYKLPADREGMNRLSMQHRMWRLLVGGLYPPVLSSTVDEALAAPQPTILDAGCGSGDWAFEMAEKYPGAHVVGVDLSCSFHQRPPANFEFVQMDITEGLPPCRDPDGYAIIHARSFTGHLRDPAAFIKRVYIALKHGSFEFFHPTSGLLILGDGVARRVFDNKKESIFPRFPPVYKAKELWPQSGSWFVGWQDTWFRLACRNYQTVDSLLKHSSFSLISSQRYFSPVGWSGDDLDHGDELGEIMLTNSNSLPLARLR